MAGERILHVGYDPVLTELREGVLGRNGYEVVSAIGNEAAKRAAEDSFDLVIIGNGGTVEERAEIVKWFAKRRIKLPVLVMRAGPDEHFPQATVEFIGATPEDWISSIRRAVQSKKR